MACWDIVGKEVNKPIYELLGGRVHDRLRSYTYHLPQGSATIRRMSTKIRISPPSGRWSTPIRASPRSSSIRPDRFSSFDPRQPSLERMELSEQFL